MAGLIGRRICSGRISSGRSSGFTVVELVMSIVLISVISVTVYSRWFDSDAFRINTAGAHIVSYARLAQRIALANRALGIHLRLEQSAGNWQFLIVQDDSGTFSTLHQIDVDASRMNIDVTAGIGPTDLSAATRLDVEFNGLGDLHQVYIGAAQGTVTSGIAITISGTTVNRQLCLSPLGFAHDGACL